MLTFSLLACRPDALPPGAAPLDLVSALGPGEVRAGVIADEDALFGGISAEGRAGDVKLYNDRVQFVIQGVRPGSWYLDVGGAIIDADVVRPDGVLGRDAVDEWAPMFGLGRILIPEAVEVVADGSDGEAAVVRVRGYDGPLGLLEGALETPGFIPDLKLELVTEYRLEPDSWLLEVTSTATATTTSGTISISDLLMGADEVTTPWVPGFGQASAPSTPRPWSGYLGDRNDLALVLAAPKGEALEVAGYELLSELASMVVGAGPSVTLQPGDATSWTRYYGVGPDLATLSAAVLTAQDVPTQPVEGQVTAPDGPVAGARVVVDVDGAPYTVAITGSDGRFSAAVPTGQVSTLAVGRATGLFTDLPSGAAAGSPYGAAPVQAAHRAALAEGAVELPLAEGRGVGSAQDPLVLGQPGTLVIRAGDGLPFTARVSFPAGPPPVDEARVPGWPDGLAAAGWARDGEIELPVEPGSYDLLVHRGIRYELHHQQVAVGAGERVAVDVALPAAFDAGDWILGDPHSHASPSADGAIPMEDRLVVAAAVGVQVHFGTDHDHLADYRPLIEPLGLKSVLKTVVADEVSPPIRGHFNIYPVEPVPELPDNGAWTWWTEIPESTEALVDTLRSRHGDGFVLQSNHPLDSGMGSSAGWQPGVVSVGERWTDRLEAVEVMNDGAWEDYVLFWYDLVGRGSRVSPVGVSDSHSHFGGRVGWSATWFAAGSADPTQVSDEALAGAIRSGQVQPTRGPLLQVDPLPGATVGDGAQLSVEVRSASWVKVDRLKLLRDGVEVEVVEGTSATFALDADQDAWFVVLAEGDTPMLPLTSDTPWSLAGPWRVDVGGDGWTPPLPPLRVD